MKWVRRIVIALLLSVWLIVLISPMFAFRLMARGQMDMFDRRIYLIGEVDAGGLGMQWQRTSSNEDACEQNLVRFLMWSGEGENATTCLCSDNIEREPDGRACVVP